jgi:hypothetical protein
MLTTDEMLKTVQRWPETVHAFSMVVAGTIKRREPPPTGLRAWIRWMKRRWETTRLMGRFEKFLFLAFGDGQPLSKKEKTLFHSVIKSAADFYTMPEAEQRRWIDKSSRCRELRAMQMSKK